MKPHIIALLGLFALTGCNVPAWGNITVMAVTFALFIATLSLGRHIGPGSERGSSSSQNAEFSQRK